MNLSDAIQQYLVDRRVKGIKPNSIRNDRQVLQLLLADVGNIQTHKLKPQHLDRFWSNRTTWGPGSMNRARHNLSSFFKWLQARGYMQRNLDLLEGHRKLLVKPRNRVIIPQEEFAPLLDSIDSPRSRAIAAIGLYLFTRVSETRILRWQDLDLEGGTTELYRTKTETLDPLPLCSELVREMKRWQLAYGAAMGEPVRPSWYVIPKMVPAQYRGKAGPGALGFELVAEARFLPEEPADINSSVKTMLVDAGYYQPHEGGHTFRRSGAIALYNQLTVVGHDRAMRIVQAMLGHSSIRTTEIYLRLDLDRKVRNDLLAGRPMFPERAEAPVVQLRREGTRGSASEL